MGSLGAPQDTLNNHRARTQKSVLKLRSPRQNWEHWTFKWNNKLPVGSLRNSYSIFPYSKSFKSHREAEVGYIHL